MTSTKELIKPEVVFDPRLGGAGGRGARYRDLKTGRLVPNPKEYWYCQRSLVGAHHWIIDGDIGHCLYCPAIKDFRYVKKKKGR